MREIVEGWLYPDLDTSGQADAAQQVLLATPCPRCGALVPPDFARRHLNWHLDLVRDLKLIRDRLTALEPPPPA